MCLSVLAIMQLAKPQADKIPAMLNMHSGSEPAPFAMIRTPLWARTSISPQDERKSLTKKPRQKQLMLNQHCLIILTEKQYEIEERERKNVLFTFY